MIAPSTANPIMSFIAILRFRNHCIVFPSRVTSLASRSEGQPWLPRSTFRFGPVSPSTPYCPYPHSCGARMRIKKALHRCSDEGLHHPVPGRQPSAPPRKSLRLDHSHRFRFVPRASTRQRMLAKRQTFLLANGPKRPTEAASTVLISTASADSLSLFTSDRMHVLCRQRLTPGIRFMQRRDTADRNVNVHGGVWGK